MTKRFNSFIDFVLDHEGRYYENDKNDPGGETHFGIDKRSHPKVDIKNLTEDGAREIYFSEWQSARCGALAPRLGEVHFDSVVNTGSGRAKRFLAASHNDPKKYNDERIAFYERLVAAKPKFARYLKGWKRRVYDLNKYLSIT